MPRAKESICDASRRGVALVSYHASEHADNHPNHTDNPYLVDLGDSALLQQLQQQLQQLDEQQLHRLSQCQCESEAMRLCDEMNIDTALFGLGWLRRAWDGGARGGYLPSFGGLNPLKKAIHDRRTENVKIDADKAEAKQKMSNQKATDDNLRMATDFMIWIRKAGKGGSSMKSFRK